MAGRGCSITLQVLRDDGQTEETSLPVALHTPLFVLKGQLADMFGISVETQVLILCDMTDPNRNSDVVLDQDDFVLRECNIRNGSVLSLHRLGAEPPPPPIEEEEGEEEEELEPNAGPEGESEHAITSTGFNAYSLVTHVTSARADHSYNGLVFDIRALGAYEVLVKSLSFGGMLGHVVSIGPRAVSSADACRA